MSALPFRERMQDVAYGALLATISTMILDIIRTIFHKVESKFQCWISKSPNNVYTRTITARQHTQYTSDDYNFTLIRMLRIYMSSLKIGATLQDGTISLYYINVNYDSPGTRAYTNPRLVEDMCEDDWCSVPNYALTYVKYSREVPVSKDTNSETRYTLMIKSTNIETCNKLVADAIAYYDKIYESHKIQPRTFYLPPNLVSNEWKRFPLADVKTFDSVFFPQKEKFISQLNAFRDGTGKYAIPGVKRQLGVLLHGPPGTGKTSLIKAVSAYLNRHIIAINLNEINSDNRLFDLLLSPVIRSTATKGSSKESDEIYTFKDVIYMLEDVDATSDIVMRRDNDDASTSTATSDSSSSSSSDATEKLKKMIGLSEPRLTLSGILNALDGVVDAPHRIVFMTTNRRASLDPALLRPGRVDVELLMDCMTPETTTQMTKHFFSDATDNDITRISQQVQEKGNITPAEFESKAVAANSLDELTF